MRLTSFRFVPPPTLSESNTWRDAYEVQVIRGVARYRLKTVESSCPPSSAYTTDRWVEVVTKSQTENTPETGGCISSSSSSSLGWKVAPSVGGGTCLFSRLSVAGQAVIEPRESLAVEHDLRHHLPGVPGVPTLHFALVRRLSGRRGVIIDATTVHISAERQT